MKQQNLTYRGYMQGLVSQGTHAAFITDHYEKQATALYRIDCSNKHISLQVENLSCGATALTSHAKQLWFAGDNGQLYQSNIEKGKPKALAGLDFSSDKVLALTWIAEQHLAVLQAQKLSIVDIKAATITQQFAHDGKYTCLSNSPDGLWLALGDADGLVQVYQQEEGQWTLGSSAKIHQAEVTALQFEANELRFYSAGRDGKLFSTHAQGELQPLDKGKSSHHDGTIQAIHLSGERFFTGADDKTLKAWAYTGGAPQTLKEGLSKVLYLATVDYQGKPHLLVAGSDASLRFVQLTPDDKFADIRLILKDGYNWASAYLQSHTSKEREQAIDLLVSYDDKKALDRLVKHLKKEQDKATRVYVVNALAIAKHKETNPVLANLLSDSRHDTVRQTAFKLLEKRAEKGELFFYEKALASGFLDVGQMSLEALPKFTKTNAEATSLLLSGLEHSQASLRYLALSQLEGIYPKDSPKAELQALNTKFNDVQHAALVRLFQRGLLSDLEVKQAVLLAQDSQDEALRHTAFLVAVLSQPELSKALKTREPELARRLQEIEDFDLLSTDKAKETKVSKARPSSLNKLDTADYHILLQGMSNQHADICFQAAFALAILQDQRAFGLLMLLSQDNDPSIRAGVCRAFAWLKQADSVQQLELMLDDVEALVRDAAFSALEQVHAEPLAVAAYGLHSQHQDIHARALKVLLDNFTNTPSKKSVGGVFKGLLERFSNKTNSGLTADNVAFNLLQAALNDPFAAIRQETVKVCLNRQLAGDVPSTLRLLGQSHYEDVHREVLNELMAKSVVLPALDWVEPQLLTLFDNDFSSIRVSALQFATKEKKRFDIQQALAAAVNSRFVDTRKEAFKYLQANKSKANQKHLAALVNDSDKDLRQKALKSLIDGKHKEPIQQALQSDYDDVRVLAAKNLAKWGDDVYEVLVALLERPEPNVEKDKKYWIDIACEALEGLRILSDTRAFSIVQTCLKHESAKVAEQAAEALPNVVLPKHADALIKLQSDERQKIRAYATYALALMGNEAAETLLSDRQLMTKYINSHALLAARLSLSEANPVILKEYLLSTSTSLSAQLVLASYDFLQNPNAPHLIHGALSINDPDVQSFCAGLMTQYESPKARWEVLQQWLMSAQTDHDEKWKISLEAIQTMAAVLVFGTGYGKERLLLTLKTTLDKPVKPKAMELALGGQIESLAHYEKAAIQKAQTLFDQAPKQFDADMWNQRAFGAYLGIVRQDDHDQYAYAWNIELRLRALRNMCALAGVNQVLHSSVSSCLLALLNHQHVKLRSFAFEQLQVLGMDLELLGNTATTSIRSDIAKQGLQLLIDHYPVKQSSGLLQSLIKGSNELLADEAYDLHVEHLGLFETAPFAFEAQDEYLRRRCIQSVAAQYEDSKAQDLLVKASENGHLPTAITALSHLAINQHPKAFELLKAKLEVNTQENQQAALIRIFAKLNDEQVAAYLLDYLCHNKLRQVDDHKVMKVVGQYRSTTIFTDLLQALERSDLTASALITALVKITGFDQDVQDAEEETGYTAWLKECHPFHHDLFVQLYNRLIELKFYRQAVNAWRMMAWVQSDQTDKALETSSKVVDEEFLPYVIQAMVFRLEKRDADAASLLKLLEHKNDDIQFLVAEGLAKNGHGQGFSILLAAVDYQTNDDFRQRAVLALGRLGDQRALDKLLKLAQDNEHYLNEAATEAIGHMAESEHQDKILKLLKAALDNASYYSDMTEHALNGLRWFNSLAAWQAILAFVKNTQGHWGARQHAAKLLRHWDTEASREALLTLIRTEWDSDIVETAYQSAQLLYKADDTTVTEADFALLQGRNADLDDDVLKRVTQYASTSQLIGLLSADYQDQTSADQVISQVGRSLRERTDYADDALIAGLKSDRFTVVQIMAQLLMRTEKLGKALQAQLPASLKTYYQRWHDLAEVQQRDWQWQRSKDVQDGEATVLPLVWANIQHGIYSSTVIHILSTQTKEQRVFQIHALKALLAADTLNDQSVLQVLAQLQQSALAEVSTLANQVMAKHTADAQPLQWQSFLMQPEALLQSQFTQDLSQAAANTAHQAQVLPSLIAKQDVETLLAIAKSEQQTEVLRMGAIEGMARILTDEAQQALSQVHQSAKDKDIAKSAYRALRRQQRSQAKAQQTAQVGA